MKQPTSLDRKRRNFIYYKFKREGRWIFGPLFVVFALLDFYYMPERAWAWLGLRLLFLVVMWASFRLFQYSYIRHWHSEKVVLVNLVLAANTINFMIAESGGHDSLYVMGIVLTSIIGLEIFRLSIKMSILAIVLSYLPTIIIFHSAVGPAMHDLKSAIIMSLLLVGLAGVQIVARLSDQRLFDLWLGREKLIKMELAKLKRAEILTRHFPKVLRDQMQSGEAEIPRRKLVTDALVGFADITGSTALGNQISLDKDWELKERFLKDATRRATQHGLIVLTHVGDGFLFLANYNQANDWPVNLISFFESLIADFERTKVSVLGYDFKIETGVKCAAAMGTVMLGFIGDDQVYFTAMGPDVNLAARLCGQSENNELIVSSRVWYTLRHSLVGWTSELCSYSDLKGFYGVIPAVRIKPRIKKQNDGAVCPTCGLELAVVRTERGHFDIVCPRGHDLSASNFQDTTDSTNESQGKVI